MFKEEHGAGDWGTDKLTSKYLKDTPGQEDAIVKSKKVVLKKKAVEEEKPAEPKNKVFHDNKDYAERQAAAKKAKEDRMQRMVRARLAGGPPRKNRGAFWKREKSVGESVEVVESDKAEYNKLMDKYGDMPMSKVPMKARLRIRELGRSVRGDKGGPTAGDLVKNMKRRRMGEEVVSEDVEERRSAVRDSYNSVRRATRAYNNTKSGTRDAIKAGKALDSARAGHAAVKDSWKRAARRARNEEVEQAEESVVRPSWRRTVTTGGWIAMYNGKKVEIKKGEAKDLYAAKLKAIQMLKVPKSKQGLLAIKPAVHEEVEQVVEQKFEVGDIVVAKKGPHKGDKHEVIHIHDNGNVNVRPVGKKNKYRQGAAMAKPADLTLVKEAKQGSYRQSPEDQKQREKNIQKGIDRMVQLGKDVKAGRKPKMSPARAKLHGEEVEQVDERKMLDKIDQTIEKVAKKRSEKMADKAREATKSGDTYKSSKLTFKANKAVDAHNKAANRRLKRSGSGASQLPPVKYGKLHGEEVEVAEGGMIGRTKPSRELNVQKDEKPHLAGVKSLKYQKRAAHKAERKKGKQDVKINPELDETVERAKRGVDMAKQRVLAAKQRVARAKARDLGQKRREMRNEDSEIEEGGMSGRDFAQAGRSADYKSRVSGTQQRYAANRAKRSARATEKHSDVMRRRAIARARSRMRK